MRENCLGLEGNLQRTEVKKVACHQLVDEGLAIMRRRYGTGVGDGKTPLAYHNAVHTEDVFKAVEQISQLAVRGGKISTDQAMLVLVAAACHDIEQSLGRDENERVSAEETAKMMVAKNVFTEREINEVKKLILATRIYFDEKRVMGQRVVLDDYLTLIIADADLSTIGAPGELYWDRTLRLLREIKKVDSLSETEIREFAKGQVAFIRDHQFYTEEARFVFSNREENMKYAVSLWN